MSTDAENYLLDTHVVLWSLYEPSRLSASVQAALLAPQSGLSISDASLWELLDKAAKGRLPFAGTEVDVIVERIVLLGVTFVPVTRADITASVSLPQHHGDPFDRMLVAQAKRLGLTLVSRDEVIPLYDVAVLW